MRWAIFMSNVHNNSTPKMILGMCWGMHMNAHHSSPSLVTTFWADIDFQDFINIYKKCTAEPSFFFLVVDTTFASDNSSCFRNNLLERI